MPLPLYGKIMICTDRGDIAVDFSDNQGKIEKLIEAPKSCNLVYKTLINYDDHLPKCLCR